MSNNANKVMSESQKRGSLKLQERTIKVSPSKVVQSIEVSPYFGRFEAPFRIQITGPSQCGKSLLIKQMLTYRLKIFSLVFQQIFFCLPEKTAQANKNYLRELKKIVPDIIIVTNFPNFEELGLFRDPEAHQLLIIEDFMVETSKSNELLYAMIRDSHHSSISLILVSQNVFARGANVKTFSRNYSDRIVFWNKGDYRMFKDLGVQVARKPINLMDAFEWIQTNLGFQQLQVYYTENIGY